MKRPAKTSKQTPADIEALQTATRAVCLTCGKTFSKALRHLTAGQIGWGHECRMGHDVRPVAQKGE